MAKMNPAERRRRRAHVSRAHGRPMRCPACGNDVWLDQPHVCPEGAVRQVVSAGTVVRVYAYNATNQCCRRWILMGWPEESGYPKNREVRRMTVECQRCGKPLHFDLAHPDASALWDVRTMGPLQPPAIVGGSIGGR